MKMSNHNKNNTDRHTLIKKILFIIFIIIICILLMTSCASGFWGKIGDLYENFSKYFIKEEKDNKKIYNEQLKFITEEGYVSLNDIYKIQFITSEINPSYYTCQTSDADIATCVVKNNYVEVYPKKAGVIDVLVYATTNGKEYIGTHKLTIIDPDSVFSTPNYSGTIQLGSSSILRIPYTLSNPDAKLTATSSNSDIATVIIENGVITIIGNKPGNTTIIIIVDDNGVEHKYTYEIEVKIPENNLSSECYLESLTISNGKLNPKFNKNQTNYSVEVKTGNITINTKYKGKQIYFYVNNKRVDNLNNITLNNGNNVVVITVVSENGESKKYTININNSNNVNPPYNKSDVNTLSSLTVNNYNLNFNEFINDYTLLVKYNQETLNLNATLKDSKSTISYKLNDNSINDISNIPLVKGNNKLEIFVTSESGITNKYEIIIKRAIRKIEFNQTVKKINVENTETNIIYEVYEDKYIDNNFVKVDDYNIQDIELTYSNNNSVITLNKGTVNIKPNVSDLNKTLTLTLNYNNTSSSINLTIERFDYYINLIKDTYNLSYSNESNEANIIFNTNLFSGNINCEQTESGIKLYNEIGYINITTSNKNVLDVIYKETDNEQTSTYVTFRTKLNNGGTAQITLTLNIFGQNIESKVININVSRKHKVILDALDGFYDSFTTKYEFLLEHNSQLNLNDYIAYKVDTTGNCLYYTIESYNTLLDGTGTRYEKDQIITINEDITLFAIYSSESKYIEITESNIKYLTDVDLFYNDEYYKEHNVEKIIYPNAHGSHSMYINNNTSSAIEITKLNLEEDTVCISGGCINMGYIIKYTKETDRNWTYMYGSKDNYEILNLDNNAIKNGNNNIINLPYDGSKIVLEPGEEVVISILWKWVDINDELDTAIGNINTDNDYALTVSIEYNQVNRFCRL